MLLQHVIQFQITHRRSWDYEHFHQRHTSEQTEQVQLIFEEAHGTTKTTDETIKQKCK